MERTERLLDLVTLLLDARAPVSWNQLKDAFPSEYGSRSAEAAERKFERDKAELLELGIPLTFVQPSDGEAGGYVVDRASYYLPDAGLTSEELAVLYAAGAAALSSAAFPGRDDLAFALRKIAFFGQKMTAAPSIRVELGSSVNAAQLASTLETLWTAIGSKKTVSIDYFSPRTNALTNRRVEPYGLALRRGAWTLVGHCHLRGAIRSFHVHRIRALSTNTARPRSPDFDIPHDFSVAAHVPTRLWHLRVHAPVNVEVSLSETLASWATRLFGANASGRPGAVTVTVTATHLDGLLETVLALGPDARIVGPETARARLSHLLTNVLGAHGATP